MKNSNKYQNDKNIKFLKTKFKKNLVSVGSWMQLPSPDIAEIFSNGDFDWITLDLEHGSFNNETIVTIGRFFTCASLCNTRFAFKAYNAVHLIEFDIVYICKICDKKYQDFWWFV